MQGDRHVEICFALRRRQYAADARGGEKVRDAWIAWFANAGSAILDAGNAFDESAAVGATLPNSGVNGYTLVEGDSLTGVAAMIGDHPHLAAGGRIEVHTTVEM